MNTNSLTARKGGSEVPQSSFIKSNRMARCLFTTISFRNSQAAYDDGNFHTVTKIGPMVAGIVKL